MKTSAKKPVDISAFFEAYEESLRSEVVEKINSGLSDFIHRESSHVNCVIRHGRLRIFINGGNLMCGGDHITYCPETKHLYHPIEKCEIKLTDHELQRVKVTLCQKAYAVALRKDKEDLEYTKSRADKNISNESSDAAIKAKYGIDQTRKLTEKQLKEISLYEHRKDGNW